MSKKMALKVAMFVLTLPLSGWHSWSLIKNIVIIKLPRSKNRTCLANRYVKKLYVLPSKSFIYIHLSIVAIVMINYRFWGALSLSRVLWKSAYSRSNMKPKSSPKQARKWTEQFQVLRQHFMFLSCCIHLHAFSFHLHASSFHCAFMSFHFPFMFLSLVLIYIRFPFTFLSFSFQCAFMSSHLPFICTHVPFILHSCPFISFLKLWKWLYMAWPGNRVQQTVIAKVIAK